MTSNEIIQEKSCLLSSKVQEVDISKALWDAIEVDRTYLLQQGMNLTHRYNSCDTLKGTGARRPAEGVIPSDYLPELQVQGSLRPGPRCDEAPKVLDLHSVQAQTGARPKDDILTSPPIPIGSLLSMFSEKLRPFAAEMENQRTKEAAQFETAKNLLAEGKFKEFNEVLRKDETGLHDQLDRLGLSIKAVHGGTMTIDFDRQTDRTIACPLTTFKRIIIDKNGTIARAEGAMFGGARGNDMIYPIDSKQALKDLSTFLKREPKR